MILPTIRICRRTVGIIVMGLTVALLVGACGTQSGPSTGSTPAAHSAPPSNGIAAKRPGQILAAAKAAVASATSVHLRGSVRQSGKLFTFDVIMTKTGAKGSMTAPIAGVKRASFDFVALSRKMYIRSSTMWRHYGAAAATLLDNRWVRLPSGSTRRFPWANTAAFARLLTTGRSDKARSVGPQTVIDGQRAVPVRTRDEIVYVATTGNPVPLRVLPTSRRVGSGGVDFLDYDAPVTIAAPAGALNFSNLHG